MPTKLYLDTARLGQMSRGAQQAHTGFARLAGEEAGSLSFDDFLRHGSVAQAPELERRFPGLDGWHGIIHLKSDLKRLVGARETSRLLLANRSSQVMRLAARLFFGPCRNVLVTDLTWPSYELILNRTAREAGCRITRVRTREAILQDRLSSGELVDHLATMFRQQRCDGLFLPAVDNFGIRLPVKELVEEVRRRAELRFVVIDGAQAFAHVPLQLADDDCDLFIAGCHKWLRGYYPMGLGFYGSPRSQDDIEGTLDRLIKHGGVDDPLLAFTEDLQHGRTSPFGETVNLGSLFSCRGALDDLLAGEGGIEARLSRRLANAGELVQVAENAGWTALRPEAALRSGIVLLESRDVHLRAMKPDLLRRRLMQFGIAATTYPHGIVRLSMPDRMWRLTQLHVFEVALRLLAGSSSSKQKSIASSGLPWTNPSPVSPDCGP